MRGDWRPETAAAVDAVEAALGTAASGTGAVHPKVGRDVVTDSDVAIEDAIRQSLTAASGRPVIGEERGGLVPEGGSHWLVDPVCGTRNFASGIPLYSVNVALVEDSRVTVAVVGDGSRREVLVAEEGQGAWAARDGGRQRLATSDENRTVDFEAWPAAGPALDEAARRLAAAVASDRWNVRSLSTTLSLAYVAAGRLAGCVLFAAPGAVHTAAGVLLVSEAGGVVTDLSGEPWSLGARSLVCAATSRLHDELLTVLREAR